MDIYTYEYTVKIGDYESRRLVGIKQPKIAEFLNKFTYILEWIFIVGMFYLNTTLIHSKLFSLFTFTLGIVLLFSFGIKSKRMTREEFEEKVKEILDD